MEKNGKEMESQLHFNINKLHIYLFQEYYVKIVNKLIYLIGKY